jgi:response regulator RpfG family c-di-GMP phosphodiesterase
MPEMQTGREDETRRTALIVNYNRWERWCTAEILVGQGYMVLDASNGASGLRLAEQNACDVILLAPTFPEMSRDEVLQHLRAIDSTREVPVIMLGSTHAENTLKVLALDGTR